MADENEVAAAELELVLGALRKRPDVVRSMPTSGLLGLLMTCIDARPDMVPLLAAELDRRVPVPVPMLRPRLVVDGEHERTKRAPKKVKP
jgi:hypothetical protein